MHHHRLTYSRGFPVKTCCCIVAVLVMLIAANKSYGSPLNDPVRSLVREISGSVVARIKLIPFKAAPVKIVTGAIVSSESVARNLAEVSYLAIEVRRMIGLIDQQIQARLESLGLEAAPLCDEPDFLRRVYLDLTGRIPTAEQARSYLADNHPEKRRLLIDELLAREEYGDHFGRVWRDWIAPAELPSEGNGGNQPIKATQDLGYWFAGQFNAGRGWDQIVTDLLTVHGSLKDQPQGIYFSLVGDDLGQPQPAGIARNIGSLFLGVQLQCAECHDDPFKEWKQTDFWGMAAHFRHLGWKFSGRYFDNIDEFAPAANSDKVKGNNKGKLTLISDKAPLGSITIPPSALKNAGDIVPAKLLQAALDAETTQSAPLRPHFAAWLTARQNPYFARAAVNRMWGYFFARGILHPVDDFCTSNDPTHPELLQALTTEFAARDFNLRHLLRCLLNSQAYQRTSRIVSKASPAKETDLTTAFGRMPVRVMSADQLYESLRIALADPKLDLRNYDERRARSFGESSPVADPYTEFTRLFVTNEEDPTDLTHGIPQYLALLNHPRLRSGGKQIEQLQRAKLEPAAAVETLYLGTLSRQPSDTERQEAVALLEKSSDQSRALAGILWMLVNRSDFLLIQ